MEEANGDADGNFNFERDIDSYIPVEVTETRLTGEQDHSVLRQVSCLVRLYCVVMTCLFWPQRMECAVPDVKSSVTVPAFCIRLPGTVMQVTVAKCLVLLGTDREYDPQSLVVIRNCSAGLLQSLLVAACLGLTMVIRLIPSAVLWGYFAFMALESLGGSQFWERLVYIVTDPAKRYRYFAPKSPQSLSAMPCMTLTTTWLAQTPTDRHLLICIS